MLQAGSQADLELGRLLAKLEARVQEKMLAVQALMCGFKK